ncbi:ribosomal protein S18 acetylase RimI-like enzyme [Yoonia maricola]|uniref:Ribosomal protein S18 acetylase RimI-like enzyme n=1 Tax=Yoonia maricola TaxID=420999 RepID=A0A2M8WND7_9RHOB|nr:GNAT family N-acetyltransferase [Yoonia maricola]PJI92434.1 ribosomal protein S18 acetylase RimI-like enzyme [Yoonia maricola]
MDFDVRPFEAADADWLVSEHATHYAQAEGFDDSFGPLVRRIVDDFLRAHDETCEAGWIAHHKGQRLGSIFCVRKDNTTAKLRLFYVVSEARGTGVAQALIDQCLGFARAAGYGGLTLWTHESHAAAGRIYMRNGLTRTHTKAVHSFGVDLVEETWQIAF